MGQVDRYSRNLPAARNNPKGNVIPTFRMNTIVANGETNNAGKVPNRYFIDGTHSREDDTKSRYPSSRLSHLLFSIDPPKNLLFGLSTAHRS